MDTHSAELETAAHTGWLVIEFIGDQSVSEIPTDWVMEGKICYWPPYKPSRTTVAIKNCELPDRSWEKFPIWVFPGGVYYDYATARAKARKAEATSDLQSDVDAARRKRKPTRYASSEESGPNDTALMSSLPSTSLLPPPSKMRKSFLRSDEIVSPRITYEIQEESFSPTTNIGIDNIDAGPSGSSTSNNSNSDDVKTLLQKANVIITQNNLLRTLLVETMERVKTLEKKLERATTPAAIDKPAFFVKFSNLEFPINSEEKLEEFEHILRQETNFQDAVNEFATFGGADTYDFIKRTLGFALSNEVTLKYSWVGRKNKEAFCKLKLASVIICAAEKAQVAANKKDVEYKIQSWLKRASDRMLAAKKN